MKEKTYIVKIEFEYVTSHFGDALDKFKKLIDIEVPLTCTTEKEILEYLDSIDKTDIMNSHDMYIIVDYCVVAKDITEVQKNVLEVVTDLFDSKEISEDVYLAIVATASEIKESLIGKPLQEQVDTIISHLMFGLKSQQIAYQKIIDIYKSNKTESRLEKHSVSDIIKWMKGDEIDLGF